MSGSEFEQPETRDVKAPGTESGGGGLAPQMEVEEATSGPILQTESLILGVERFSKASAEIRDILPRLAGEVKAAAEQLDRIASAVEAKKKELKTLHGVEATAVALERMALEHQHQKEVLERAMAGQRAAWEEEKANRVHEEREYREQLQLRREREEEAYRQQWSVERLKAQQKLEEELKAIHQESLNKQQAIERDCLERELKLKEKELEWVQLIQELEQFMAKLTRRAQAQAPGPAALAIDEPKSAVSSLKEILVAQGQRIESLKS